MTNKKRKQFSPNDPARGRGAAGNPLNRFERVAVAADPDVDVLEGWTADEDPEPRPQTIFLDDTTQTIVASNNSPDVGFEKSLNPYRGCEHGCAYCYARPTHEYLGFSAGLDFETRIMVKRQAPQLLARELAKPGWKPTPLLMSGVTDCYQPVEKQLRITRGCLEVLLRRRNPVMLITKNRLIARDADILGEMARMGLVSAAVSVTTLDPLLARRMEPRTSTPAARLEAIATLAAAGVPTAVMMGPVVPGLTDHEAPRILEAAAKAGASGAGWVMLRLPHGVKDIFPDWLERWYPERKAKVLGRLRGMRDGELNSAQWGERFRGTGVVANEFAKLFEVAKRKAGLDGPRVELRTDLFRRETEQLSLF